MLQTLLYLSLLMLLMLLSHETVPGGCDGAGDCPGSEFLHPKSIKESRNILLSMINSLPSTLPRSLTEVPSAVVA